MEVLMRYGTKEQQERWLRPLMNAEISSSFLMTEPAVASSDATNIETSIVRDGDEYVINGRKWFSSGVMSEKCELMIVMGKTDPNAARHQQQSQILVPKNTPGVTIVRPLTVYGYTDAPQGHGEVLLEDVRVPVENIVLGEGRGFEIAQGRLGPGRIHHCMRIIGACENALKLMTERLASRVAFGKRLMDYSVWDQRVAEARTNIEMLRLLCLKAAYMMDTKGNKSARTEISMIKLMAPSLAMKIHDDAIQAFGGGGLTGDFTLANMAAQMRTFRFADGPDEVHARTVARQEFRKRDLL
jgi:alkylation response protein AidB-like acyl-CoA dehydrogenase